MEPRKPVYMNGRVYEGLNRAQRRKTESKRGKIEKFNLELDAVCRSLNIEKFNIFWTKYRFSIPEKGWHENAREVLMHKTRITRSTFSQDEKRTSIKWLRDNKCLSIEFSNLTDEQIEKAFIEYKGNKE